MKALTTNFFVTGLVLSQRCKRQRERNLREKKKYPAKSIPLDGQELNDQPGLKS